MPANGAGRVRKNSVAGAGGVVNVTSPGMRPRANTISHIDGAALNNLLSSGVGMGRNMGLPGGHSHHPSLAGFPTGNGYDYRSMSASMGAHGNPNLAKLDTQLGMGMGGGLRTAPIASFNDPFDMDKLFSNGSTINPAALHFPGSMGPGGSPFQNFGGIPGLEEEENFDWTAGLENPFMLGGAHEQAIDESSPSAMSTTSQSGFSEVMVDGSNNHMQATTSMWHNPMVAPPLMQNPTFSMDAMGPVFAPELLTQLDPMSPHDPNDQSKGPSEFFLSSPPQMPILSPASGLSGVPNHMFHPSMSLVSDSTSIASTSLNGSARQSSVTSISSDSITDATRQALIMSLSQAFGYGQSSRKFSQPSISSPLSPSAAQAPKLASLPSTQNLQRYVNAYIQYFHPHMPFLHVPTLSFDTPTFTTSVRSPNHYRHDGNIGGGGCLILAMAAIGALYEFDTQVGKELFEAAKKLILFYLEERRRAGLSAVANGPHEPSKHQTPLWLVQAMLLNLVFGHNCGDKQAAEVATTHIAALVSLSKAAELDKPARYEPTVNDLDVEMGDNVLQGGRSSHADGGDEHAHWIKWKKMEERKRTYFAVYVWSSLLVNAYSHAPRILNSEIRLDLPCDEDLWLADSAQTWKALGGAAGAQAKSVSFAGALSYLLESSLRDQNDHRGQNASAYGSGFLRDEMPESELKPSTYGCYILINALHIYIWETRQRHTSRHWKAQEMEAMHAQVEPALKAWQAAWKTNPQHSIERPNPFSSGPLSADSIPLLDLAYVRLFVNLGRSKDACWQWDFDTMAEELARSMDIVQGPDTPEDSSTDPSDSTKTTNTSSNSPNMVGDLDAIGEPNPDMFNGGIVTNNNGASMPHNQSSKRERQLRKAAFYAADSLGMAEKLGLTYMDFASRELSLQAPMCQFDCAQVLAEWVATVQERVGRYLGVLGKDDIDFTQVPAIMLLEEEDIKLLQKVADIVNEADLKLSFDGLGMQGGLGVGLPNNLGFGSKLLLVTANMLRRAAVWPGEYDFTFCFDQS